MTKSKCGERTAHVSWWGCPFRARPNKSTGNKRYQTTFHPICVVIIKVMYFTAFSPATHLQAITPTEKRPYFHKMCTQSLHDAWSFFFLCHKLCGMFALWASSKGENLHGSRYQCWNIRNEHRYLIFREIKISSLLLSPSSYPNRSSEWSNTNN